MHYDWSTKSTSSETNKQKIKAAQLRSEHDSTINKKREAQGKKER